MKMHSEAYTALLWFALFTALFLGSCGESGKSKPSQPQANDLINETSPYLLQHAHNPVDWKPWGKAALETAKEEGKLVIVSIGYSSCHWCHVMEEETFENEEAALLMNEHFINIKVDREERPDVDQVYMTAAQLLTGSGGWPLNVITLPNGKPIYAGTYHTTEEWMKVLSEISTLYKNDPQKAIEYADKVAQGIQAVNLIERPSEGSSISRDILRQGVDQWKSSWDLQWGGNKGQQKFMLPSNLDFLLDYALITGDKPTIEYVKTTLDKMAMGGVYDQVGGGFYRYSTDPYWRVPHFEKMLYDNAQLISLYSKAFTIFNEPLYRQLVLQTTEFLDREMKHPEGAYYAAMDADSDGEEGAYYVWKKNRLQELLGEEFTLFSSYYGISEGQEWEDGNYILNRRLPDEEFVKQSGITPADLQSKIGRWNKILLSNREKRNSPRIDDKIITSWNALLITGFVDAFEAFGDSVYLEKAQTIHQFLDRYNQADNKLLHSYKAGSKRIEGFLEDYALLTEANLELYLATNQPSYLERAKGFMEGVEDLFYDEASGFYRFKEDDELIATIIKTDDGVMPSPNSVMAHNLFRMGHIVYDPPSISHAGKMLSSLIPNVQQSPDSHSRWAKLMLHKVFPYYEVAVVGPNADELRAELWRNYVPNALVIASDTRSDMPLFKNRYIEDETYIYVCQNHSCKLPVITVPDALRQLVY